ncbi:MAG TPA: SDR family NAD(P)-dependent oxidoreductase [Polyangiaceae bacterium]|nr:SDR family NAD(P)-dependent oxidoreductase [Polyangiaceae bacterium]
MIGTTQETTNEQAEVDRILKRAFDSLDFEAVKRAFESQGEFVFLEGVLPPELAARMAAEVTAPSLRRHRSFLPFIRSAGHVGYRQLSARAPLTVAVYRSPHFVDFMSRLTGKKLYLKSDQDDHACTTYEYTRRGDGMQFHYDTCGCEEEASYSMIVGILDRSSQRLMCDLNKKTPGRPVTRVTLKTPPGSMALFCGSKVWHGVSPLGEGEHRIVLSLSYASNPAMPKPRRFAENVKDAVLYFGPSALWQKNYNVEPAKAGTRVLVTGASSGIGEAVAFEYARRGARLALFARGREGLEEVAARCRTLGAEEARVLVGDTTDKAAVEAAAAELAAIWPRIDRAFLNAGGYGVRDRDGMAHARDVEWSVGGFSAASTERVMRLNYLGVVYWLEALLPAMRRERSGTIAVTGAQAADRAHPKHGPYAASKAAVRALVDSLRPDAGRYGVRLCLIEPGCVESGMTRASCCDEMPFIQPTDRSAERIVRGVEGGEAVIRFPWYASAISRLAAAVPRPIFDAWAEGKLGDP